MRRRRGFTLIEIIYAIALTLTAAIVVATTMPISTIARVKASYLDKAMGLGQKELESIRGLGYSNATATQLASFGLIDSTTANADGSLPFTNVDLPSYDAPAKVLPNGTGSVLVEQVDIDLRRVTITVNWQDRGKTMTYTVGTLIANL